MFAPSSHRGRTTGTSVRDDDSRRAQITQPQFSPFASGTAYGLRVAAAGSTNWGQGAETGKGLWVAVNLAGAGVVDASGNIILRTAQTLQRFTGYYRPEDMDVDPIALAAGTFRVCWANTGRISHAGGSTVENSAVRSEVMCLVEELPSMAVPSPATGTIPTVERFVPGSAELGMFDNVAFQPYTGNLVILEDGPTSIVTPSGSQPRGNDMWICLPDGADPDIQSDGCVRFASLKDTTSEPTGFIFRVGARSLRQSSASIGGREQQPGIADQDFGIPGSVRAVFCVDRDDRSVGDLLRHIGCQY